VNRQLLPTLERLLAGIDARLHHMGPVPSEAIELPEDITPEARTRTERRRAQRIATLKEQ